MTYIQINRHNPESSPIKIDGIEYGSGDWVKHHSEPIIGLVCHNCGTVISTVRYDRGQDEMTKKQRLHIFTEAENKGAYFNSSNGPASMKCYCVECQKHYLAQFAANLGMDEVFVTEYTPEHGQQVIRTKGNPSYASQYPLTPLQREILACVGDQEPIRLSVERLQLQSKTVSYLIDVGLCRYIKQSESVVLTDEGQKRYKGLKERIKK